MVALTLASTASWGVDEIIDPAAVTDVLNSGEAPPKCELFCCVEQHESSDGRSTAQLSATASVARPNIREHGSRLNIENQSSGVIPIMKLLEDTNQLGARQVPARCTCTPRRLGTKRARRRPEIGSGRTVGW